jgi:nitrite reductase (NADH) small subunit/3-phenylpropionate/trans-cinnamate dioxygenase ferredoxin subunit
MTAEDEKLPLFPDEPLDPPFVTVAQVGEIAEGHGRAFPIAKRMVAVFLHEGQYFAIDDFCPHQGASLAEGYVEGCAVACPWHHWRFSLDDGSWLDNPKIKIDKFKVRVFGQDIQVQVPEAPQ